MKAELVAQRPVIMLLPRIACEAGGRDCYDRLTATMNGACPTPAFASDPAWSPLSNKQQGIA